MVNISDLAIPIAFDEEYSFVTPYLLVYGTLRKNQGNYKKYIEGKGDHMGTYRLKKYSLGGILANYTAMEEDSIVVDLFKLKSKTQSELIQMYEVNCGIDILEWSGVFGGSNYITTILPIKLSEDQTIRAKMYVSNIVPGSYCKTGDFLSQVHHTDYPFLNIEE